jgi:hypothetical protein
MLQMTDAYAATVYMANETATAYAAPRQELYKLHATSRLLVLPSLQLQPQQLTALTSDTPSRKYGMACHQMLQQQQQQQ